MDFEKLFALAKPFLEQNDLGAGHTSRVLALARQNFAIPKDIEDLTVAAIILHDIGGCTIKDQYEKGPCLAASLLQQMGYSEAFIVQVCIIVGSHHDHPENPSVPFRVLYDSDKLVMFSKEEFSGYDRREGFDWDKIIASFYSEKVRTLATQLLRQRRTEKANSDGDDKRI